ncbi:hypothetical protein BC835DRAFT_1311079 [Cytidiella melzeri]|nr:hypothetical protein BC835DRAFT_1311079 [Cytidiella melzeri]
MCRLQNPRYNLSQESLTSMDMQNLLREVCANELELWNELNINFTATVDGLGEELDEDIDAAQDTDDIDASIPLEAIKSHLFYHVIPAGYAEGEGGGLEYTHNEACADGEALP